MKKTRKQLWMTDEHYRSFVARLETELPHINVNEDGAFINTDGGEVSVDDLATLNSVKDTIDTEMPKAFLREERNSKLVETDWWNLKQNEGIEMTQAQKDYRQALRDLPSTADPELDSEQNLTSVTWPTKPE